VARIGRAVLRIAAAGDEGADRLAEQRRVNPIAQRRDVPRYFEPRQRGSARRGGVEPLPLGDIGAIHPGIGDADQHFAGRRLRHGNFA
jgi:hypothetical protein